MQVEARLAPDLQYVQSYYDERIAGKLQDFTQPNPRIEAAIQLIAEWAPASPKRILEIGCGIGATSWRMARAWPQAEVIGADVSPASIEVAQTCFQRPNLRYRAGLVTADVFDGKFDLILLMDVYEHIAPINRASLHTSLRSFLADESRLIVTIPTPAVQEYARLHDPSGLQPVDEDIDLDVIKQLARDTATELMYYRMLGIWEYGDYAHIVFGRYQQLAKVARRAYVPPGMAGLKQRLKQWLGVGHTSAAGLSDYLGTDVGRSSARNVGDRFKVSLGERRQLAARWAQRNKH